MFDNIKKYRSEELKEITLSSNIKSYRRILIFIFSFIAIVLLIGVFVKYPEKLVGKVIIISNNQVNNIYSPNSGEVLLKVKEDSIINEGDLLALIKSPTNFSDLQEIKNIISNVKIDNPTRISTKIFLDKKLKLGEIEKYYYDFLLAVTEYENFILINEIGERIKSVEDKLTRNKYKNDLTNSFEILSNKKFDIEKKSFEIDSLLFEEEAIVKDQIDKSRLNFLRQKEKNLDLTRTKLELFFNKQDLQNEIILLKKEKEKDLKYLYFNVKRTFFELRTAIDFWEHNYTIRAPKSGRIEFYQPFFNSTQYVKKNTPLFIILPKIDSLYAKGIMSSQGYGKIKLSDTVYIKLNDYPYKEYGKLKGVISKKSKVYHDSIYYLDIKLSDNLKTNYKKNITFSYNMSGQVEYFTDKRNLIQRVFSEVQNSTSE